MGGQRHEVVFQDDGQYLMPAHESGNVYELQYLESNGSWQFERHVRKLGAGKAARNLAHKENKRTRVWNVTKKAVYLECIPK